MDPVFASSGLLRTAPTCKVHKCPYRKRLRGSKLDPLNGQHETHSPVLAMECDFLALRTANDKACHIMRMMLTVPFSREPAMNLRNFLGHQHSRRK